MQKFNRNYLLLHLLVFIWGFTGILGKLISLGSYQLVWYRLAVAPLVILGWLLYRKSPLRVEPKHLLKFSVVGLLIAAHWILFYESIKVSNVSVSLACFSSGALFSAFLEPFFYKRGIRFYEVFFGAVVIVCLWMISNFETKYTWGIILGIASAFMTSLFGVLNSLLTKKHDAGAISFYELGTGFIFTTIYMLFAGEFSVAKLTPQPLDILWLLLLTLVCTCFTFITSLHVMKEISAYTVSLTLNLESVYSIVLAYFIFGKDEQMSLKFYGCTLVILATVFTNAWFKGRMARRAV